MSTTTGTPSESPRRATINDVAALAGTSKGTVSFVLNDRAGVAAATRERVLAAIDALGFEPSQAARSLANARRGVIGLILARAPQALRADSFFAPFISGVEYGISDADSALLLRFVESEDAERTAYRKFARGHLVDGVILADLRRNDPRLDLVSELSIPAVTLNRADGPSPLVAVCNDDTTGIEEAAEHLVELGHRRIAHVSGPMRYVHASARDATWRRALAAHGVTLAASIAGDFTGEGGAKATRYLLDAPPVDRPTAIAYDNDTMAVAGMRTAQSLGLDVPADVSIVGFDDTELAAYVSPALTTITTDPFAWGASTAQALLAVIEGEQGAAAIETGASRLVLRESTATVAST